MKKRAHSFLTMVIILIVFSGLQANNANNLILEPTKDTLNSKETRKEARDKEKTELRNSHARFSIKLNSVFAKLDTKATFQINDGIFSVSLGLEDNFGLPGQKTFFTGSFLYRITPRSGIYAQYYGINREENHVADQEYYFLDDTIAAGSSLTAFFNTQVISAGYLLSILKNPNAFLGFYFNLYVMNLSTGVIYNNTDHELNTNIIAPFPNFGLIASFKLTKMLYLDGTMGYFTINTNTFGGSVSTFDISLIFKPVRWLGINLSYKQFDVNVFFLENSIKTTLDYNFRGPSVGLTFMF